MYSIDQAGLLKGAIFISSPNFNARPVGCAIDLMVIHCISLPVCQFGGQEVIQLFTNQFLQQAPAGLSSLIGLRVSSHLFIRRDGEIIQFVPFPLRAWHAGVSEFQGRSNCNDFSIGIELEGCDQLPYADIQYDKLNEIIPLLRQQYPAITADRIVGHSDIAPGRKTDPGPLFEWGRLKVG